MAAPRSSGAEQHPPVQDYQASLARRGRCLFASSSPKSAQRDPAAPERTAGVVRRPRSPDNERRESPLRRVAGGGYPRALAERARIPKMMERAASSRSTRPRNSKSAEASNLAGMPFVEGPERILPHVHEEPPSPGHWRRPVLGEFPVEVVSGGEEVTRLARCAPPPSRLLAEFLEAGERCGQFRQHSEDSQRVLSPRAVFQLGPIEFSPRPSKHDRKRAQEGRICARETEREGESCFRSESPIRSPAAQRGG